MSRPGGGVWGHKRPGPARARDRRSDGHFDTTTRGRGIGRHRSCRRPARRPGGPTGRAARGRRAGHVPPVRSRHVGRQAGGRSGHQAAHHKQADGRPRRGTRADRGRHLQPGARHPRPPVRRPRLAPEPAAAADGAGLPGRRADRRGAGRRGRAAGRVYGGAARRDPDALLHGSPARSSHAPHRMGISLRSTPSPAGPASPGSERCNSPPWCSLAATTPSCR
jgi:hypothetical protein